MDMVVPGRENSIEEEGTNFREEMGYILGVWMQQSWYAEETKLLDRRVSAHDKLSR